MGTKRRLYPIVGPFEKCDRWRRPGVTHCTKCKVEFGPKEIYQLREIQVNWFRGDDEVEAYHEACLPAASPSEVSK